VTEADAVNFKQWNSGLALLADEVLGWKRVKTVSEYTPQEIMPRVVLK
jgi:hypothetical protein